MKSPRNRKRSGPSRPQHPTRSEKTTILIVGEGRETEHNYFDGLKREECVKKLFAVTVKRGKGRTREEIAQFAVEQKNHASQDFDEVWCVMDVEQQSELEAMRKARNLLTVNDIKPALSNPSIEVWFLAHFEQTGKNFMDCDAAIKQLNKHWQKHFKTDYKKSDARIYQRLAPHTNQAVANAKWVQEHHHDGKAVIDGNSSTDVHLLVEKLRGG